MTESVRKIVLSVLCLSLYVSPRGHARPSLIGTKTKEPKWCICNAVLLTLSHAFTMFHTTVFLNYMHSTMALFFSFSALVMHIHSKMSFLFLSYMNSLLFSYTINWYRTLYHTLFPFREDIKHVLYTSRRTLDYWSAALD